MKGEQKMKVKFKKALAVLCAVSAICSVAGCGRNAAKDGEVSITVGDFFPDEAQYPEAYAKVMDRVSKFEEKYPGVKVSDPKFVFNTQTYMAMAEAGTLPTTYYIPLTESKKIIDMGYAADLTDEIKSRGLYDKINSFTMDLISKDGHIYYLPQETYDQGIIVNVELYKKAGYVDANGNLYQPKTWEDLAEVAKKIKETTGVDGFAIPTTDNCGGWRFMPIAWGYGTQFETQQSDGSWKATFNSPECVKALQYLKDLKWKHKVMPEKTLLSNANVQEQFAAGNVAMTIAEANTVNNIVSSLKFDKNNMGMLKMPAGDYGAVSLMGGGLKVVDRNATPAQTKAALDWYGFTGEINTELTDEVKEQIDSDIETEKQKNVIIGVISLSPWNDKNEVAAYRTKARLENVNVDIKHLEQYNDKTGVEYRAEEPIECQALYAVLDTVVQEILINKDADPKAVLDKAAADFQSNTLDKVSN